MAINDLIAAAQVYFPKLQIKYKDQDPFMKFLGKLMFFNPAFMTSFVTTLGDTVYLPSQAYMQQSPQGFMDVFIHECTHMHDEAKHGILYKLGYALPQLLAPLMLLLLFVLSWKIVIPLALLMFAPLPAPFRAYFEKRAYFVQMFVGYKLWGVDPVQSGPHYAKFFRDSSYYFMWPFEQDQSFIDEGNNIKAGHPACAAEPDLLQMVNDLMAAAKK